MTVEVSASAHQTQEALCYQILAHLPTVVLDAGRQTSDVFNGTRRYGTRRNVVIPASKVLGAVLYHDGVDLRAENRQKREVFRM